MSSVTSLPATAMLPFWNVVTVIVLPFSRASSDGAVRSDERSTFPGMVSKQMSLCAG